MLRRSALCLTAPTKPKLGGGWDDLPQAQSARFGAPSNDTSTWIGEWDIRHKDDGRWGPTHYGGDQMPTMAHSVANLNPHHPMIEPLFHTLLTHEQKMCRLYKRCLVEMLNWTFKANLQHGLFGFYARQIRAEFEKNRDADKGSAEWLFVRAVFYVQNKKHWVNGGQEWAPGRTYWGRYAHVSLPNSYTTFPHGFDPCEAHKMMNVYHRFGIPNLGTHLAEVNPHNYVMRHWNYFNPYPGTLAFQVFLRCFWGFFAVWMALTFVSGGVISTSSFNADVKENGILGDLPADQKLPPKMSEMKH